MSKKILTIVFSLLVISGLTFGITWGVINFNQVKQGMATTGVYTIEDVNKSYEDGYDNALTDKAEYTATIAEYRDAITSLNDKVSQLNYQITTLTSTNNECKQQIGILSNQKNNLESQVTNLQTIKLENEDAIKNLDNQINSLQVKVSQLETNKDQNANTINDLNSQIANLQSINSQLQITNQINADTIANMNTQIVSLNNQIHEMSDLSQNSSAQITALNNRINELQSSVSYYENFISTLENNEQVVATFEVDGSVWKIEIINKGSELTLNKPANTDTLIINGWKVNGQGSILGNTYILNANTKFVADVTHKYAVQFMNDEQIHNKQYVIENEFATIPTAPNKAGYEFLGWSLNGVDVINNIDITAITETTVYYATYIKLHTVTFMNDNEIVETQIIRNGENAVIPTAPTKNGYEFLGWSLNGTDIENNINTTNVTADTIYQAKYVKIHTVEFIVEDQVISTQNIRDGEYANDNVVVKVNGGTFVCWQIDNSDVNVSSCKINHDTTFVAKINYDDWQKIISNSSIAPKYGSSVWTDGINFYGTDNGQVVWDKETKTWSSMKWYGATTTPSGWYIWNDGKNIYYSYAFQKKSEQYILDIPTHTWSRVTWNGELTNPMRTYMWTDGKNWYYSYQKQQYVVNTETQTWSKMQWNGLDDFYGNSIWSDGVNCYYSAGGDDKQFILDVNTHTWRHMQWNFNTSHTSLGGSHIWTDGTTYYYSSDEVQLVLDKTTNTWSDKVWTGAGLCNSGKFWMIGEYIWSDGENVYYQQQTGSYPYKTNQYILIRKAA